MHCAYSVLKLSLSHIMSVALVGTVLLFLPPQPATMYTMTAAHRQPGELLLLQTAGELAVCRQRWGLAGSPEPRGWFILHTRAEAVMCAESVVLVRVRGLLSGAAT